MATKIKGIDISRYNGSIDFKKVKDSGIEFVMIRCGTGYGQRPCKDVKFETYYKQAKAAGLKVGTYFYSYAPSVTQARTEAAWVLDWIKGKQFDYPIVFDMEEQRVAKLGKAKVSAIAIAFCSVVEHAGYYVSIYSSKSWIESYYISEVYEQFDVWVAQWASKCTYEGSYGMWQYTDSGEVPGISGAVDMNYAYKDYASIIKNAGLNGFKKPEKVEPKPSKPVWVKPEPVLKPKAVEAGDKLVLEDVKLYANSTTSKARKKPLSGVYYIYDGKLFGNRYRITNSPKRVGKKPAGLYVTGYINKEDVR
jgi:GH25 family lysozyme M1 (1,4-beta-N-acetylmuramidase)